MRAKNNNYATHTEPMMTKKRHGWIAGLASIALLLTGCGDKEQKQQAETLGEYPVAEVQAEDLNIDARYPATIKGKLDVEIRPQIAGQIVRLAVDEGASVKRGQTLFVIDPVQYREQVNAARAAVRVAETSVKTAQLTVDNNRQLADGNIIGPYAMQTSENALATAQAQLAQAKAQLATAEKNLSFTNVTSPTTGVVGAIPYRVGSLVSPSMPKPLTTVSDISEMYAYFSLTERQLLQLTQGGSSIEAMLEEMPPLRLVLLDGSTYPHEGKIATVSGILDPVTGSINARVLFPNPDKTLLSGSTGTVVVPTIIKNGIRIPQRCVYQIQERTFVYLVDDQNVVHSTEISVQDQNDGQHYIVTEGLKAGDTIVLDGIITLRDGAKIQRKNSPISTETK